MEMSAADCECMGTYIVESYDANDDPDERVQIREGEFPTSAEAHARACIVVEASLRELAAGASSAAELKSLYDSYGAIPMIFREPDVVFDPYAYAEHVAQQVWDEVRRR